MGSLHPHSQGDSPKSAFSEDKTPTSASKAFAKTSIFSDGKTMSLRSTRAVLECAAIAAITLGGACGDVTPTLISSRGIGPDASTGDHCGDGFFQPELEFCDYSVQECCNETCTGVQPQDFVCRPPLEECGAPTFCDGMTPLCPGPPGGAFAICGDGIICGEETCDDGIMPPEDFDGCDQFCQIEPGSFCEGEPSVCFFTPLVGEIFVSEIMQSPVAATDTLGEWFEIHNQIDLPLNLEGLEVTDDGSDFFIIDQPIVVPPFGFVVLGNNADMSTNGGIFVDYQYTNTTLEDGADEIHIFNPLMSELLDSVSYSDIFPLVPGASMSLDPLVPEGHIDNDQGFNWCPSITPIGGLGDFGTPGQVNVCSDNFSLTDAFALSTGVHSFAIGGDQVPLFVDGDFAGGGWVLVGRGREGWAWDDAGLDDPALVKDDIGTPAAFAPRYLPSALIDELITNGGFLDLLDVEIRIKRAATNDGAEFQEVIWLPRDAIGWTWLFDGGSPTDGPGSPFGYGIDFFVDDSSLGLGTSLDDGNTEDHFCCVAPAQSTGLDDHTRIFTWPFDGNGFEQGFAYGLSVLDGDTDPASFLLNNAMDHPIPYTEVYVRLRQFP